MGTAKVWAYGRCRYGSNKLTELLQGKLKKNSDAAYQAFWDLAPEDGREKEKQQTSSMFGIKT